MKKTISFLLIVCLLLSMTLFNFNLQTACASESMQETTINDTTDEIALTSNVTIADGVYYIKNKGANLYMRADDYFSDSDVVCNSKSTVDPDRLFQLWKVKNIGNGYYTLRPMSKLDLAMDALSGNITSGSTADTDVYAEHKWMFSSVSGGYKIQSVANGYTLGSSSAYNGQSTVSVGNYSSNGYSDWVLEQVTSPPSGLIMYIEPDDWLYATERSSYIYSVYSATSISQDVNLTSSNERVATILSDGEILALSEGSTTITVTSAVNTALSCSFNINVGVLPNGVYSFRNKQTDNFISIPNSSTQTGTVLEQDEYDSSADEQKWYFQIQQDGSYTIRSEYNGLYLGIVGGSTQYIPIVQDTYTGSSNQKWVVTRTSSGAYKFSAKANASVGMVMSAMPYGNGGGTLTIRQMPYANDTDYLDEWYVVGENNNVIKVDAIYDETYLERYPDAAERINYYMDRLQIECLEKFGIHIEAENASFQSSYADDHCTADNNEFCDCLNSLGNPLSNEEHHTDLSGIKSYLPAYTTGEKFVMYYMDRWVCYEYDGEHNECTSSTLGVTIPAWGFSVIKNTNGEILECKTALHELLHIYGAPDHYYPGQTNAYNASYPGMYFSDGCIYGANKDNPDIATQMQICNGCKTIIEYNITYFDH